MDTLTDQQIQARFLQLPPDLQKAIQSSHVEEHIQSVGAHFGLHIDQLGALKDATYLVMLGFVDPETFAADIADFAHLPKDTAAQIAQSIGAELFVPIRQSMQDFAAGQGSSAPKTESYAPAVSTPPLVKAPPTMAPVPTAPPIAVPTTPTPISAPSAAKNATIPSATPTPSREPLAPTNHQLSPTSTPPVKTAPPAPSILKIVVPAPIVATKPGTVATTAPTAAAVAKPSLATPAITTMSSALAAAATPKPTAATPSAATPVASKTVSSSTAAPSAKERVAALAQTPAVKTAPAPAPAGNGYTVDPYREPIE